MLQADKKGKAVQVPAEGAAQCETSTGSQVRQPLADDLCA